MSTNFHIPIAIGAAANSSIVNAPLGSLDDAITNLRNGQYAAATELTINASGLIAPTQTVHTVAANSGTTDNLDDITLSSSGVVTLSAKSGHTITVRNNGGGTGNIRTYSGSDLTLSDSQAIMAWRIGALVYVIGGGSAVPLPISQGGTNAITQTAAFDNLAPTTTKGDVIVHDGSDNVRKAVGSNGWALAGDSSQSDGLVYIPTPRRLFSQTSQSDIDNTNVETTLFGTGQGSLTIPANALAVGSRIHIELVGYQDSAAAAGNIQVRFYLGGVAILDTTARANSNSLANRWTNIAAEFTWRTIGSTGTYDGQGRLWWVGNTGTVTIYDAVNAAGVLTIDTTAAIVVNVTWQYGTANIANEIHITNAWMELIP